MTGRPPTGYPPETTLPCACKRVSASTEGRMVPLTSSVSWSTGSRGSALRRFIDTRYIGMLVLLSFLLLFHHLQALDHLEGEAHHAAFLSLVLDVDGLIVVVDEDLGEHPTVVVEALSPLWDGPVAYLAGLLAHRFAPSLDSVSLPRRGSVYPTVKVLEPLFTEVRGRGIPGSSLARSCIDRP